MNRQMLRGTFGEGTRVVPSLGASGAIYGCLSITAFAFPEVGFLIPLQFLTKTNSNQLSLSVGERFINFLTIHSNSNYDSLLFHDCFRFNWFIKRMEIV